MSSDLIPVLKPELPLSLPNEPQPAVDDVSAKLYMDARDGVVKLSTDKGKTASGFFVGDTAHVLTSAASLIGSKEQFAIGKDGKQYKLELEKMDELKDLAVLRVIKGSIPGARPLPLGDMKSLNAGDRVWSLSFPQVADSTQPYLSPGYVRGVSSPLALLATVNPDNEFLSKLDDTIKTRDEQGRAEALRYLKRPTVESRLHIEDGSIGSPVLQRDGQVVAMNTLTNALAIRRGQTLAESVDDIKGLLAGKGRYEFSYKNMGADWAEGYKADWQDNKGKAVFETALTGGLAGFAVQAANRYPVAASAGLGAYGLLKLSSDFSNFLDSTDSGGSWKYGLASLSDLGTVSGAALALAPKLRVYGLALAGLGLAGRAATDFIQNRHVLDESKRLEGDPARAPFKFDDLSLNASIRSAHI